MALTPEQQAQINALKAQYAKAQSSGDKAGMASANQQANAIRNSAGMVAGVNYNPTTGASITPSIANVDTSKGGIIFTTSSGGKISQSGQGNAVVTSSTGERIATNSTDLSKPLMGNITPYTAPQNTTTPTTTPTTTTTTGGGTTTTTTSPTNEYINKIFEAQQKANVEKFYQARNQAAAQNQQQVRNFAEYMANRGLTGSGAGAQSAISQSGVYQANIGSLLGQEAQAQADIGANQAKASLDQFNTDRNFALQEAGLTGKYQGKETLEGTKARLDNIITEAKANNASAIAKAELDKIKTDVETGKQDLATATAKAKNIATQISNENALAVAKIDTQKATTTKVGAQTGQAREAAALSKAKAGQVGKETPKTTTQKTPAQIAQTYIPNLSSRFATKNVAGGFKISKENIKPLQSAILSLGLDDATNDVLFGYYGLPIPK